jgi:hypothetical protein
MDEHPAAVTGEFPLGVARIRAGGSWRARTAVFQGLTIRPIRQGAPRTEVATSEHPLAARVRSLPLVLEHPWLVEQRMFGGVGFLVGGNLACAASERGLLVRVDPDDYDELLAEPEATEMVMRGRIVAGWLRIPLDPLEDDDVLERWVGVGVGYAASLPPK